MHFGCVDASLDWRYDDSLDHVDFTFVGTDEGTEVSGRGWAKMEGKGKQMIGQAPPILSDAFGGVAER